MKVNVLLYYSPECVRNWLAYLRHADLNPPTCVVEVDVEVRSKAKNAAITCANRRFEGCRLLSVNRRKPVPVLAPGWEAARTSVLNWPELADLGAEAES